ncbi:L-fuculokinase [uncultured Cohaesibacter sp.]|uniref:L-fuculokinase n=1 Tax=uncultured Cohaesibacter sp. TaxID=1002546 RepID=UPI00292DF5AA|nr:L-fuculokinase [uncultured Cohaesibacter sp.]
MREELEEDAVLVLDCGSTNVRAIAVSKSGKVIARATEKNATFSEPGHEDWHYWSFEGLCEKLFRCARQVTDTISAKRIRAVTVTTFGGDGTFLSASGDLIYPVISWKCTRTIESQTHMERYIDPHRVTEISGVGHFSFNTLNKFIWFREHHPEILHNARHFLFVSSLFTHRLTGRLSNDATLVGTSQMTDLKTQDFSEEILDAVGIDASLFPETIFPGEVVGPLLKESADAMGLLSGTPVISAGHDTQFAIFGAGATPEQPVLSSGTWEILMARCPSIDIPSKEFFEEPFTCEWDVCKGYFNPGYQYVASAVIEWFARLLYPGLSGAELYESMIREAMAAPEDCNGVIIDPDMLVGRGVISGLSLDVDRGILLRATLNGMVTRLKKGLAILEQVGNFKASQLTMVGGGTRNQFWTQLKANALGIPINVLDEPETTVLGASMFALTGAGLYASADEARDAFSPPCHVIMPQDKN